MNYSAIIGLCLALSLVLMAILLGSPLTIFIDVISVYFLVGGTLLLTLAAHGTSGWSALYHGLRRMVGPRLTKDEEWGQARCQMVSQVARTAGTTAIMMAACGAMIGLTQMMANLDDPNAIGPAFAVCLLCTFYAIVLNLFLFVPMTRYFHEAAIDAA